LDATERITGQRLFIEVHVGLSPDELRAEIESVSKIVVSS
jgi:hypothetical protein